MRKFTNYLTLLPVLSFALLTACGGGGGGGGGDTQSSTGNLTTGMNEAFLSWVAPVTNADGTPLSLSEIAGYRVYSGLTNNNLALAADVTDGSATSYTVTGLPSGTHYFALTTYDYSNNESAYSNIASKAIP